MPGSNCQGEGPARKITFFLPAHTLELYFSLGNAPSGGKFVCLHKASYHSVKSFICIYCHIRHQSC